MLKISFLFTSLLFLFSTAFAKVNRPDQYVLLAFDGSKSVSFWKDSRAFAQSIDIDFTYFMSGVYFLPDNQKGNYVEPKFGKGKSAIGFGGAVADLPPRLEQVRLAVEEGHEMASHANAHYDGAKYSAAQWTSEFQQFTSLMTDSWNKYGNKATKPAWWDSYFQASPTNKLADMLNHITGFRAPLLGHGAGLYKTLKDYNFSYDTSRVDKMNYWPQKIDGIWNFPLAGVKIHGTNTNTLSMDYNFYFAHSKGVKGPASKFALYEEQMYGTYMGYFNNNYYGNRAPIHIGHHFSLWNGGAYWNAMKRFAEDVCSRPEVRCVTYKELLAFVEANQAQIASYQKGDFDKYVAKGGLRSRYKATELTDHEIQMLRLSQDAHFETHDDEEE